MSTRVMIVDDHAMFREGLKSLIQKQADLEAIGEAIQMPILVDYNQLALLQVDLDQRKVSFPQKETFFKKVLDTILFQAHLTSEIRIDEANKPFVWVTSTRK